MFGFSKNEDRGEPHARAGRHSFSASARSAGIAEMMPGRFPLYVLLFLSLFFSFNVSAGTLDKASFPSLISAARISPPLDFCGEPVPLHEPEIRERLELALLLALNNRAQVILWLKRVGRYFPHIQDALRRNAMPDDLKYIAVAESALLPNIGSARQAVGFWQFIESTGRVYKLRIDSSIDERRNIFTSTRAAIQYLKKLHQDFNSWTLAAAAYNMGENGLQDRIASQKIKDYYRLDLPSETERYLFRILAIKLILSDPGKYGFRLTEDDIYSPQRFDRVRVQASGYLPLQLIAEASSSYLKKIKDLNPQVRRAGLPPGTHSIRIPKGAGKEFHAKLGPLVAQYRPQAPALVSRKAHKSYVVKRGDSLSLIAQRHGVSVSDLKRWNRSVKKREYIYPGQRLIIR